MFLPFFKILTNNLWEMSGLPKRLPAFFSGFNVIIPIIFIHFVYLLHLIIQFNKRIWISIAVIPRKNSLHNSKQKTKNSKILSFHLSGKAAILLRMMK